MQSDPRLFQQLMQHVGEAVYLVDSRTGRLTYGNRCACEQLGRGADDLVGRHVSEVSPSLADLAQWLSATPVGHEVALQIDCRRGHTTRPAEARVRPLESGGAVALFVREGTPSASADAPHDRKSRDLLLCRFDAEMRLTFVNRALAARVGAEPATLLGEDWSRFLSTQDRREVLRALRSVRPDRSVAERTVTMQFAEEALRTHWNWYAFFDPAGRVSHYVGVGQDVTARQRAVEALEESEAQRAEQEALFRSIHEGASVGIAVTALDGRLLEVNPALGRILGRREKELHGQPYSTFVHPDDVVRWQEAVNTLASGERKTFSFEQRVVRSDGEAAWLRADLAVKSSPAGRADFLIGVFTDVTHEKQAEAALAQKESELQQAQKLESVGRLAGGVAHDFNNLLTVIVGRCELLHLELGSVQSARHVEEIQQAGERGSNLVRQLLAFSRRQALQPEALDLNEVLGAMEPMLDRLLGDASTFRTSYADRPVPVKADRSQLEQLLLNLVLNSRDAMGHGGTITVRTATSSCDDPGAVLTVRDDGPGMDETTRDHAFEPFFTTKPTGEGSGLGLSTVYGIVKQSGGEIRIDSAPGEGTTVRIDLPFTPSVEPRPARPATDEPSDLRGSETVLFVEDEPHVRAVVERALREYGYTPLIAADAAEARRFCEEPGRRIAMLVLDVVMPGESGPALAHSLEPLCPQAKVLYVSGYSDEMIARHGVGRDDRLLLEKPFTTEGLLRRIRNRLGEREHASAP